MDNTNNDDSKCISLPLSNGNFIFYNYDDKLFYSTKPFRINKLKEFMEKNGYEKDYYRINELISKIDKTLENQKSELKKKFHEILKNKDKKKEMILKKDTKIGGNIHNKNNDKNKSNSIILIYDDDEKSDNNNNKTLEKDDLLNSKRKRETNEKTKIVNQKKEKEDKNNNIISKTDSLEKKTENQKNQQIEKNEQEIENNNLLIKPQSNEKILSVEAPQNPKTALSNNSFLNLISKKVIYTYTDILQFPEPDFEDEITYKNVEIGDDRVVTDFLKDLKFSPLTIIEAIRNNYKKLQISINYMTKVKTFKDTVKRESFNCANIIIKSLNIDEEVRNNKKNIAGNICANRVLAKLFKDKIKKYIDLEKHFKNYNMKGKKYLNILGINKE